jgi:pyrroloquinoline quinone biosynthesis protein D
MIPRLVPHCLLKWDKARDCWVLLAPETVMIPDENAAAILQRCDGRRTVAQICAELAQVYEAEEGEIEADVRALIEDLARQGVLTC